MKTRLLIGTYTETPPGKSGEGIYVIDLDPETGAMTPVSICRDTENPSFLISGNGKIYAAEELQGRSAISAWELQADGTLQFDGRITTEESGLCHLCLWPDGRYLSGSCFGSGTLVTADVGTVPMRMTDLTRHTGSGPHEKMQRSAHVHSATLYPRGGMLLVCDLGNDTLATYQMNSAAGTLDLCQTVPVIPGDGPRHAAFSPDGRYVSVCMQLSGMIDTYEVTPEGLGRRIGRVSMLPEDYTDPNDAADIHYSEDGRHLYASNRGFDSIVVYDIRPDGAPGNTRWFSCFGAEPRNFRLLKGGKILMAANQTTGNLVSIRIDPESGDLIEKLDELTIPQAVCVLEP